MSESKPRGFWRWAAESLGGGIRDFIGEQKEAWTEMTGSDKHFVIGAALMSASLPSVLIAIVFQPALLGLLGLPAGILELAYSYYLFSERDE